MTAATAHESPAETVAPGSVGMSASAARRVRAMVEKEVGEALMLRVAVGGGGCSGFQYSFTLDDQRADDDHVVTRDGATMVIDDMSWEYLSGGLVDYVEELIGAYFTVRNPNATSTCGCGTSFAVG